MGEGFGNSARQAESAARASSAEKIDALIMFNLCWCSGLAIAGLRHTRHHELGHC